jgi:hypothetical protein
LAALAGNQNEDRSVIFSLFLYYYFFKKMYSYMGWLAHISIHHAPLGPIYMYCIVKSLDGIELQGFFADCSTLWAWACAMAAAVHSLIREFIESYCLPGCLLYTQHPIVVKQIVFLIPGLLLAKVCAIELQSHRLLLAT